MRVCTDEQCGKEPDTPCENALAQPSDVVDAHSPITVHDHEYGEWYCQSCWDDYSEQERGLEWFEVEETNGEEKSRAESEGATS